MGKISRRQLLNSRKNDNEQFIKDCQINIKNVSEEFIKERHPEYNDNKALVVHYYATNNGIEILGMSVTYIIGHNL